MKKYELIVAVGNNNEIGHRGKLLWSIPEDMEFFQSVTIGNTVVMGRKTWESLPKKYRPLPYRENIVVSRDKNYKAEGAVVIQDLNEIPNHFNILSDKKCIIIGGAGIYREALERDLISRMYITRVDGEFIADTYFPQFETNEWKKSLVFNRIKTENKEHSFKIERFEKES